MYYWQDFNDLMYGSHQDRASLLFRGLGLSEVDQSLDDEMLEARLEDVLEDPLPPGAVLVILGPALGEVHQLLDVVLGQGLQRVLHRGSNEGSRRLHKVLQLGHSVLIVS